MRVQRVIRQNQCISTFMRFEVGFNLTWLILIRMITTEHLAGSCMTRAKAIVQMARLRRLKESNLSKTARIMAKSLSTFRNNLSELKVNRKLCLLLYNQR